MKKYPGVEHMFNDSDITLGHFERSTHQTGLIRKSLSYATGLEFYFSSPGWGEPKGTLVLAAYHEFLQTQITTIFIFFITCKTPFSYSHASFITVVHKRNTIPRQIVALSPKDRFKDVRTKMFSLIDH